MKEKGEAINYQYLAGINRMKEKGEAINDQYLAGINETFIIPALIYAGRAFLNNAYGLVQLIHCGPDMPKVIAVGKKLNCCCLLRPLG